MAAEQEPKELSMAEILASIRKILEENGAEETRRHQDDDDEVLELTSSMIVAEANEVVPAKKEENFAAKTEIMPDFESELRPVRQPLPPKPEPRPTPDQAREPHPEPHLHPERRPEPPHPHLRPEAPRPTPDQAREPHPEPHLHPERRPEPPHPHPRPEAPRPPKPEPHPVSRDVSEEIVRSFTRMFEQNDFRRKSEQPVFDADALLRQIVRQAVSARLDNLMLQNMVKETIVPVLEEWLSHYLPKLVAEEIERVMVKAGRR